MAARARLRRRRGRRAKPAAVRRCPCQSAQAARKDAKGRMEGQGGVLIGGALDPAEKAADRMAAQALAGGPVTAAAGAAGTVHRKCAECEAEEKAQRDASPGATVASGARSAQAGASASSAINGLGAGRPLAKAERSFFEPRFGRDFSGVRVHDDAAADRAARAIDARAFAWGDDIAFAMGERAKGGDRLMAHELAHVAQEGRAARRTVRRAGPACDSCPSPVNPEVEVKIAPNLKHGTPTGSPYGSTNWGTAKVNSVSVAQLEKRTCDECDIGGKKSKKFELCPNKVVVSGIVDLVLDWAEIRKEEKASGKDQWTECGAPQGADMFDTEAAAKAAFSDPKRKTVAGVIHHETYHVGVSERAVAAAIKARGDLLGDVCPYSAEKIKAWREKLQKDIKSDTEAQLKANPGEPNEELNASIAECTKY